MNLKTFLILLFSLTGISLRISAQSFKYVWGEIPGGNSGNEIHITTDADGNILATGEFVDRSISFGTTTLTNAGSKDIFVVKYDPSGNVLWAKSAGGTHLDGGKSISTDEGGNVLVTGYFYGSITFGKTNLISNGGTDIFVVKFDASGNVVWAKSLGGDSFESGTAISSDANGNVLVTGYFKSSILSIDKSTFTNKSEGNREDIFIVKYDVSGKVLWAKSVGGTDPDNARSICTDASGNILLTGEFESSSLDFDTFTIQNALIHNKDIFIVKLDASGNTLWAKSAGGGSIDAGTSLCTDAKQNILVTGYFYSSSITFGKITLTKASGTNSDMFVVKYDASGNLIWAKSAGESGDDAGIGICTDAGGNIFVNGIFDYSPITFGQITLTSAGSKDIFIVEYDAKGDVVGAESAGGIADDNCENICIDANGNVFISGFSFSDSIKLGTSILSKGGPIGVFTIKLSAPLIADITDEQSTDIDLIYPNPFSLFTTIQFKTIISNGNLNIYNVNGQLVKVIQNISGRNIIIYRESIPSGIYFVSLIENNKVILSNKLVITD